MYTLRYLYKDGCWFTLLMHQNFSNETEAVEYAEAHVKSGHIKEYFLIPLITEDEC